MGPVEPADFAEIISLAARQTKAAIAWAARYLAAERGPRRRTRKPLLTAVLRRIVVLGFLARGLAHRGVLSARRLRVTGFRLSACRMTDDGARNIVLEEMRHVLREEMRDVGLKSLPRVVEKSACAGLGAQASNATTASAGLTRENRRRFMTSLAFLGDRAGRPISCGRDRLERGPAPSGRRYGENRRVPSRR